MPEAKKFCPPPSADEAQTLVARCGEPVCIKSEDGEVSVTIAGTADGAGVWVHDKQGRCVHLFGGAGQGVYAGFHHPKHPEACPLAVTIEDDGKPILQICHPHEEGGEHHVHFIDLVEHFVCCQELVAKAQKSKKGTAKKPAAKKQPKDK